MSAPLITRVDARHSWTDFGLREVWANRELLYRLVLRDIQVLYRQAALGVAWVVLQPLLAAAIFTVIFGVFVKTPSEGAPYAVFALAGVLPWTYFAESVRRASAGLVDDVDLLKKVYFPRLILPLAKVAAPLLDFAIGFVVLIFVALVYGVAIPPQILLAPLFALPAAMFALAVVLWFGPLNVRFRDVKHTLPFLLQVWMYATPVVYSVTVVPQKWRALYALNPMVGIVEGFRWAVLGLRSPDWGVMGVSMIVMGVMLFGGLIYYRAAERNFADLI